MRIRALNSNQPHFGMILKPRNSAVIDAFSKIASKEEWQKVIPQIEKIKTINGDEIEVDITKINPASADTDFTINAKGGFALLEGTHINLDTGCFGFSEKKLKGSNCFDTLMNLLNAIKESLDFQITTKNSYEYLNDIFFNNGKNTKNL